MTVSAPRNPPQSSQEPLTTLSEQDGNPLTDSAPHTGIGTYGCGRCETRWRGVSRAHCSACHRTFAGPDLFDKHRRESKDQGMCLDPEQITSKSKVTGELKRVMFLVDGLWSQVEERQPRIAPKRWANT